MYASKLYTIVKCGEHRPGLMSNFALSESASGLVVPAEVTLLSLETQEWPKQHKVLSQK